MNSSNDPNSTDSPPPAPQEPKTHRRSPWWAKLALLAVSTLFAIGFLEIGLRIVGRGPLGSGNSDPARTPTSDNPRLAAAQTQGWIPTASESEILTPFPEHPSGQIEFRRNRDGIRSDQETSISPAEDVQRVLVVGDSHSEGMVQAHETFSVRLQQRLNQDNARWEVLNGAFRRASPLQEYWAYEQAYGLFEPKVVVVGFFVGNDLMDLLRVTDRLHLIRGEDDEWLVTTPQAASNATEDRSSWTESLKRPLRKHSAIYRSLTDIPWLRSAVVDSTASDYRKRLEAAAAEEPGWVWQAGNQVAYFRAHPDDESTAWAQMEWIWRRWKESLDQSGRRMIVVLIPTGMQSHPRHWMERRAHVNQLLALPDEAWTDLDRQYEQAQSLAESLGIETLDLLAAIRSQESTGQAYFYEIDQHLNVAGHELVAELLEPMIANREANE